MPFCFEFGLGEYFAFSFTFSIGPGPQNAVDGRDTPRAERLRLASPVQYTPSSKAELSPPVTCRSDDPLPQVKSGKADSGAWQMNEMEYANEGPETPPSRAYLHTPRSDDLTKMFRELESCKQKARPGKARKSKSRSTDNLNVEKRELDHALDQLLQRQTATGWAKQENSKSLFFSKLPPEVRAVIYQKLLVSAHKVEQVSDKLGWKRIEQKMLGTYSPVADIDSTILRTCRAMYDEALPILYGCNVFCFSGPRDMATFSSAGLDEKHAYLPSHQLYFGLRYNRCGRLALIRRITLRITTHRDYTYLRQDLQRWREAICLEWLDFLVGKPDIIRHGGETHFPLLDNLELDFRNWTLGPDDSLYVDPYIQRFSKFGTERMKRLAVRGIKHEPTLKRLKDGLMREGGVFKLLE